MSENASTMTKKTSEIFKEYMVPQNLQEHMLKVAALAEIITGNWKGPTIDKDSIVQACIYHDIAKPMTFDLAKQAQFGMSPEGITNLEKLQNRLKAQYGTDEHQATVQICKEVNLSPTAVKLVNNLEWSYIPRLLEENDIESLIPIYCDMRIGPKSLLTVKERHEELQKRESVNNFEERLKNGMELEKLVAENVSIDPNSITDDQINARLKDLLS